MASKNGSARAGAKGKKVRPAAKPDAAATVDDAAIASAVAPAKDGQSPGTPKLRPAQGHARQRAAAEPDGGAHAEPEPQQDEVIEYGGHRYHVRYQDVGQPTTAELSAALRADV